MSHKKIYFASDFHLGADARYSSKEREKQIVRWLDLIKQDAEQIYLVGDVFDFWFEYASVVPKGYTRLLGKLAELSDTGIDIRFFIGNHDMWMFRYFEEEIGIKTYRTPTLLDIKGKIFFIAHGDGLGPGDHKYKFLKKVFSNPICQWLFARIHPNLGIGIAKLWSGKSRGNSLRRSRFKGDKEWLLTFANQTIQQQPDIDFFIFGHRHLPMDCTLNNGCSRYINLGEWLTFNSYAVFDGQDIHIQFFENDSDTFFRYPQ